MRTEEHNVSAYVESDSSADSHGGANRAERPPIESSRMDRRQFADLRPRSPMQSRWSRQNGGNQESSASATHAWVASQSAQPMPRVPSPVSTLRSVSPPVGRPHIQPAPSHALPLHAPTPIHPPRPMSDNSDGYVPLLDGDAMPGVSGRQTRFSPRPVASHDGDWGDWHSRTNSPVFTEPPVSESSHSGWHDSQFQPDPTPGIPGMTGTGRPRPPGMNPANNPWTSQFRPWQNMMQGGFGIAAMIAETFINVVQSIAQIFQKWGESMVSLTRR